METVGRIRAWALAPLLSAAMFVLLGAGSGVPAAEAKTVCKRFGNTPGYELRKRPARRAVVCFVNRKRRAHGVTRLRSNRKLQRAAQDHNDYMVRKGCFAHECAGEGSLDQRLFSVLYLHRDLARWSYGENIGWATAWLSSPRRIVRAWMASPPHRANILNPTFEQIGVGVTHGTPPASNAKGATYTTDFGRAD